MGYKQNNSPFTKLGGGFTDPKRIRRNNKAYEFNQKGLEDILNVTADGAEVIDDKSSTDKTGTENEGEVGKNDKALDGMNSIDLKKIKLATGAIKKSEEIDKKKKSIKDRKRNAKLDKQNLRRAKRLDRRDEYADDEDLHKLKEKVEFNKKERKNLKGKTTSEAQSLFDDAYSRGIENAKKEAAEAKKEEERFKKEEERRLMNQNQARQEGKGGTSMYKQNDMDNKEIKYGTRHLKSKGSAFPMVAQTPKVDAYGNPEQQPNRAARGFESNQLTNNPNIQQPANKVANSTFNTNQQFSNIASSAGEMDQTRSVPQSNYGNTPAYGQPAKALIGDQPNLPDHLKAHINAAPGMYDSDGPASFKGLVSKLESEGKSKESATKIAGSVANAKMEGAGSGPTEAQKARSKGPGMHGDHAHTKITKGNVKSAEKDDAAHIDYLKRDINYDAKHGGSNKQMTNDEKHISKLAGDIKYDHKHHGRKYDNV